MGAEGDGDRLVLGGDDVLLEEDSVERILLHEQTRRSSVVRLQTAERVADFIDTRLRQRLRYGIAEDVPRPHFKSHFVQEPQCSEPLAMRLVDLVFGDSSL